MKIIKRIRVIVFALLLLIPFSASSASGEIIPTALVGTWGGQSLERQNNGIWTTDSMKITFDEDGTGTSVWKSNDSGTYTESTENFIYTVSSNIDGSFTISVSSTITGGETDEIRFVLSDDGTIIIVDGTVESSSVWMKILIKLDTTKSYTNANLSGNSYFISYEHDAQGGTKGYYRAESGISSSDGAGTLSFTTGKLNGDGTILDNSGGSVLYAVSTDGSVSIDGVIGYLSGNGLCGIFSNPATVDDWMNVFAMAKGDKSYVTTDLEGTWAFTGFGDSYGTSFRAEIGDMTCNSAGNCTYSLKMRQSDGTVSYISGSETLSVAYDGRFGLSLPGGISYAGAIGNNGNTLIMNRSFDPNNLNDRDVIIAVKCIACSNLAGVSPDEEAIRTRFQAGVDAYNSKDITTLMSCFSANYLDDGINKTGEQTEVEEEFNDSSWQSAPSYTMTVTVASDGLTATTNVTWAGVETETMHWIKENDGWMLYGNQKKYGVEAWSQNWHNGQQYMVHFEVEDPNHIATSVTITGTGITNSLDLEYDISEGCWNSWHTDKSLDFGNTPPTPPLEYTFTIADSSETTTDTYTVQSFVNVLATDLSTSWTGATTDPLVFSWTGVGSGGYTYQVQLSDVNNNRIWDSEENMTTTSVSYNVSSLTPGAQYHYWVVVEDQYGNASFAEGNFVHQATQTAAVPGDVNGDSSVNLADAILALKVAAGMNPSVSLSADVNSDSKIGLTEVVYILQKIAGLRPTLLDTPSAPTGVTATAGDGQVTISWSAVSGATSYNIYCSTTSGVTKTTGTEISNATSDHTHTGLTNGTTYYYIVTAVNFQGESVESAQVSATPAIPPSGWIQTSLNASMGRSLYATDTEIFAATYNGVYSTIDDGMSWFSKGLQGVDVSDVIKSNGYILAATLDGVYRSSDNGDTWLLSNGSPGVSAGGGIYGPHVFAKNSTHVFIIAWAQGIFRSIDDGENWEQVLLGQDDVGYQDYAAGAIAIYTVGERIFMDAVEPDSSGYGHVLWSSSDNGNNWSYTQYPFDSTVQSLWYDNGKLFACGDMGVYLSTDLGNSWSTQYSNTIGDHGQLIGVGTFRNIVSYNQNLIAAVDFNSIYISSDNGQSWTSFNDGLISDWTFTGLAIKPPYIWALREGFGNAYRRPLADME